MANIDIKPSGLIKHREVDLISQLIRSLQGICQKLDDDAGVPLETYEANCITAIFNLAITDTKGNFFSNRVAAKSDNFQIITPRGITDKARLEFLYQFLNAIETLTEQLDTDVLTDSTYEALCYTALMLHKVESQQGETLGNGVVFYFRPGGVMNQKELVEFYYNAVNAIETLTEQLDADGTVTDTDYEATWFTATILTRIENGAGSAVGNTSTDRG